MKEVVITLPEHWRPFVQETVLMHRLSGIVHGTPRSVGDPNSPPYRKASGYKWQLDNGNDWFSEIRGDDRDQLVVVHRYGNGVPEKITTLIEFLKVWL